MITGGLFLLSDGSRRLEAVHLGHLNIHEDNIKPFGRKCLQYVFPIICNSNLMPTHLQKFNRHLLIDLVLLVIIRGCQLQDKDQPQLLDVVRPLCVFAAGLPKYVQKTMHLSGIARQVRDALLNAREPATLLFRELPKSGSVFPEDKQEAWFAIAKASFRLIYNTSERDEATASVKTTPSGTEG